MASNSEYEQQQFWEDKHIEVILGDNSNWDITLRTQITEQMFKNTEKLFWEAKHKPFKNNNK